MQKNLIVFIKNPILGTVKTRLASSIGDKTTLDIYKGLIEQTRRQTLAVNAHRHLFYFNEIKRDAWSKGDFKKYLQIQGDLGAKMKAAFAKIVAPDSKTIIIGSDCYDLTAEIIEEAFVNLSSADVVLGPANDGGYYLLGTKKYIPELFDGISWSTESVLEETKYRANDLGLRISLLQELIDVDTIEDLKKSRYPYKSNY